MELYNAERCGYILRKNIPMVSGFFFLKKEQGPTISEPCELELNNSVSTMEGSRLYYVFMEKQRAKL